MRVKMPSPAMVVALLALVVAMSGTAVAAVTYADRAGSVDGKSAVSAKSSLQRAAGRLVATQTGGPGKGRISAKFLDDVMRGGASPLSTTLSPADNQAGRVTNLAIIPGIGSITAQCNDIDATAGVKATQTRVQFTATAPGGVNVSRLLGRDIDAGDGGSVFIAAAGRPVAVINRADSLFQLVLNAGKRTVLVTGAARSDRPNSAAASCVIWGAVLRVG